MITLWLAMVRKRVAVHDPYPFGGGAVFYSISRTSGHGEYINRYKPVR